MPGPRRRARTGHLSGLGVEASDLDLGGLFAQLVAGQRQVRTCTVQNEVHEQRRQSGRLEDANEVGTGCSG